ncbi:MAG: hypothetical protein IJA16_04475, partial [Clostridia bacterium]|nr:hypothetical protein [Clostridia bacterium]
MKKGILDLFDKVTVKEPLATMLEGCTIEKCRLDMLANRAEIILGTDKPLPRGEVLDFAQDVAAVYRLDDIDISFYLPNYVPDSDFIKGIIDAFLVNCGSCRPFLMQAEVEIDDREINISKIIGGKALLTRNGFVEYVRDILRNETGADYEVNIIYEEIDTEKYLEERDREQREIT